MRKTAGVAASSWSRLVCGAVGAALAGPGGAITGGLVGELLAAILPTLPDVLGNIAGELTADAVRGAGTTLLRQWDGEEVQLINHDLQAAFRDAIREALYDIGGQTCFPEAWKRLQREVPSAAVYPTNPPARRLWEAKDPVAEQVCDCLHGMERAIAQRALLPLMPPRDQPATDARVYLEAETPAALNAVFFEQAISPYLARFRSLLVELPGFERHLRHHLLDRTLVHLGELLKARTPAWRAFNRLLLQGLRSEVRRLARGQTQVLNQLDTLLEQPDWADGLADLLSTTGRIEKRLDEGFGSLIARVGAQHQELLIALGGITYQLTQIEADVQTVLPMLEEVVAFVRGASPSRYQALDRQVVAEPHPAPAMLRERQRSILERHRLFEGRAEEMARIHDFVQSRRRGYVLVTGPSGFGKTSLLANLVAAMPDRCIWHFLSQADDTHHAFDFLRQMCEQMLAYYQMPVQRETDLPDRVDRLEALYAKLVRMPLVRDGQSLVLVIDGLDEAEGEFLSDRHIPRDLPDGKFIVFSARAAGRDYPAELGLPADEVLTIHLDALDRGAIRALLQAAGGEAHAWARDATLVEEVAHVSRGDPFYLRFLVQDIAQGDIGPTWMGEQPTGLENYLDGWWQQVVDALRDDQDLRNVLGTLMVARGPVPRSDLFRLYPDLEWRFDAILRPLRRFLVVEQTGGEDAYALCHDRFRAYLQSRKLQNQAAIYGARLLDYCARWLDHGSRYALRHYAGHLAEAGEWDRLHALLATGEAQQAFAEARHAAEGSYAGYLADLQLAWNRADGEARSGTPAVEEQVRYALIASSLHSLARNVPAELTVALVERGEWAPRVGLEYVLQSPDRQQRLEALPRLLPHLPEPLRAQARRMGRELAQEMLSQPDGGETTRRAILALAAIGYAVEAQFLAGEREEKADRIAILAELGHVEEALALARATEVGDGRVKAMAAVASILPEARLPELLAEMRRMEDENLRVEALASLAPHAPEPLLGEVLTLARAVERAEGRWEVLARLAPRMGEMGRSDEALAILREIGQEGGSQAWRDAEWWQAEGLVNLAPSLSEPELQEALEIALVLRWALARAWALAGLVPYLVEPSLGRALGTVQAIEVEGNRIGALARVCVRLAELGHHQEALATAEGIEDPDFRSMAVGGLARHLPDPLLRRALEVVRSTGDAIARVSTLAALAPHLPEGERRQTIRDAQKITQGMGQARQRVEALAALIPHLSEVQRAQAVREALAAARKIEDELQRGFALATLAPLLAEAQLEEALAVALGMRDEYQQAQALVGLAPSLSRTLLQKALTVAGQLQWRYARASALGGLAPFLQEPERATVLREARTVAEGIEDEGFRARALSELRGRSAESPQREASTATDFAQDKGDSASRSVDPRDEPLGTPSQAELAEVVARAWSIEDPEKRANAIQRLACHLGTMPMEALAPFWSRALHILADRTREDLLSALRVWLPSLMALGGEQAAVATSRAIRDVGRWWP